MVTFATNDCSDNEDGDEYSQVIPTSWLLDKNTKAYWPSFPRRGSSDKRTRLIMSLAKPDKTWPVVDVRLRHCYGEFLASFTF